MDLAMLVLSAGVKLWVEVRESIDADIRRQLDLLFLADVVELRKRLSLPVPPGFDPTALAALFAKGGK